MYICSLFIQIQLAIAIVKTFQLTVKQIHLLCSLCLTIYPEHLSSPWNSVQVCYQSTIYSIYIYQSL